MSIRKYIKKAISRDVATSVALMYTTEACQPMQTSVSVTDGFYSSDIYDHQHRCGGMTSHDDGRCVNVVIM